MRPHTSYLICGTPRSGSFLHCEALKNRYLNIEYPENLVFAERRLRKQADALSEEWVRRYEDLKRI